MTFDYVRAMSRTNSIYLDHAAGTWLLPQIQSDLAEWAGEIDGNPSSIHAAGRNAAKILDKARMDIAHSIGAKGSEILFTSGGTEANNLALLGLAQANQSRGSHIISCATEHPSTIESLKYLENAGFSISYLPVDANGDIDLQELAHAINDETILISLMWVNNETGLIHSLEEIVRIAHSHDILVHSDAVQAVGHLPIRVDNIAVDALSLSGHKLGTPAGIGCLYLRKGTALAPLSQGGSQENNLRAGTQNLLGARALAHAITHHQDNIESQMQHYEALNKRLHQHLGSIPMLQNNRGGDAYSPHINSFSVVNVDGEALFIRLDMKNICVSNGSACSSGSQTPSHVLTAMGFDKDLAQASLRISFGLETTPDEVDAFCEELVNILKSLQGEMADE